MKQIENSTDLFKVVGEKPFIWRFQNDQLVIAQLIKNGDSLIEISLRDEDYGIVLSSLSFGTPVMPFELVDWFEESVESIKSNNLCNCEFVKLLQEGCKCGGQ